MSYIPIGDRIREQIDRIKEHKATIIQYVVYAAIAVAVSATMILTLAPSKGAYNAAITSLKNTDIQASASINKLGTDLGNDIADIAAEVQGHSTTLNILGTKAATNSHDIDLLQTWADDAEARIATAGAQSSPPEGYLTGTVGNYTLYAKCSAAGNFTANVHLVYSPPVSVSNATTPDEALQTFYGSINWTAPTVRDYVPVLAYNSTTWQVSQVWFNIGIFAMEANTETAIDIIYSGLDSIYSPDFAYVEVWPVLK